MWSFEKVFKNLNDNNEFSFLTKLKPEERQKILDFQKVFNQNINPNNDKEIEIASYLIFFTIAKIYLNYKDVYPTVSVKDDPYKYYVIQPTNNNYQLLDYLINKLIDNVHKIEFRGNQYDYGHKILSFNTSRYDFIDPGDNIDYYNLEVSRMYLKSIAHELGHALHCCHFYESDDGLVLPCGYQFFYDGLTQNDFINRIKNYEVLSSKYNIIKVSEKTPVIESANCPPSDTSGWDNRALEEAFTEMEAEDYANLDMTKTRHFNDNIFFISKTLDNGYSLGANFMKAYLNMIPKQNQFEVAFLGKDPTIKIKDYTVLEDTLNKLICNPDGQYRSNNEEVLHYFSKLYETLINNNHNCDIYLFPIIDNTEKGKRTLLAISKYYQDYLMSSDYKHL